jgi:lysophospholipase L1-like esterase
VSASREQFTAIRGEGVSYRLELTQRAAIAIVLSAFGGIAILDYFEIGLGLGLFASQRALSWVAVAVTLVVLLSAWFRHRQGPILTAFLLMGAAAVTCIYADDVLLVAALAVGITSAGYLAAQFVGFLLPVRRQPRIDAAAINVTLVLGSISSMLVLAEVLLWILSPSPGSPSGKPASVGSLRVPAIVSEARAATLLPAKSAAQTLAVRTPTLAEADALLEPGVVAAARRRVDALSMPPEWERRETQVPGASRAVSWHGVLHVYNSDGFRMIGSPPTKDPSLFRVLVLGDSLTYGDGIEERFTYSRQLERLLRRRWRVEIVDAGVDGAQSEDIVRIARRLVPELQPDLVIYGVCLNDFLPSGVGQYDGSIRLPQFIRSRTRIGPVAELLISNAAIRLGITRDFYDDILHGIPEYRERFARDARDLNSFVREHEIPPVIALVLDQFVAVGGKGQHIAWLAEQALAAAGVTVLNTDGFYQRFSEVSPMRVSRWEGHPNEEVNAVWALMLEQAVERDTRLAKYVSQVGRSQ